MMKSPDKLDVAPHSNVSRLIRVIDAKFILGHIERGGIARQHEELIALRPTLSFDQCPSAVWLYLQRPIPEEADEAAKAWPLFGGHRVTALNTDPEERSQTIDFYISDGKVVKRDWRPLFQTDVELKGLIPHQRQPITASPDILKNITDQSDDEDGLTIIDQARLQKAGTALTRLSIRELIHWVNTATIA